MRRVILESPLAGDFLRNVLYAQRAMADCFFRGEAPLASHLLYPMVLDENNPKERGRGIDAGHAWLPHAEMVVAYVDYGVSPGMRLAIDLAGMHKVPVDYRYIGANGEAIPTTPGATQ